MAKNSSVYGTGTNEQIPSDLSKQTEGYISEQLGHFPSDSKDQSKSDDTGND